MKRFVSIWLPDLAIDRMQRVEPGSISADRPLALVSGTSQGQTITAVNACARREGIRTGLSLADARAMLPALLSRPAEPERDRSALLALARWAGRYGPSRNIEPPDGIWIDITGVAHLFAEREPADGLAGPPPLLPQSPSPLSPLLQIGGEIGEVDLLLDLGRRLARSGLTARLGLADTPAGAAALARYGGTARKVFVIAPAGELASTLAPLPVEALRLATDAVVLLKRLGLRRIGQLYDLPRPALARRFRSAVAAEAVLVRLDEALGRRADPRRPLAEQPPLAVQHAFSTPLISSEGIEAEVGLLAAELGASLEARGLGLRRLALALYRTDASVAWIRAGTSRPSRAPEHLLRLLRDKLVGLDAGFGIDLIVLSAQSVEPLGASQTAFAGARRAASGGDPNELLDRLANRLGAPQVTLLAPHASHIPERAARRVPALSSRPAVWTMADSAALLSLRPPFLLDEPEPIAVVAEVPDGPPVHFTWRRRNHRVTRAEGPERIAPEWWRTLPTAPIAADAASEHDEDASLDVRLGSSGATRDYYRIEDAGGAGYWVFRRGLYQGMDAPPAWFMHGVFA